MKYEVKATPTKGTEGNASPVPLHNALVEANSPEEAIEKAMEIWSGPTSWQRKGWDAAFGLGLGTFKEGYLKRYYQFEAVEWKRFS
ncbi:MAG: hypothetical protein KF678_03475 [Phycisphaeraceae bacterium]|nr:hypothetical protein [Phycisphaeraceae bacterium]